MEDKRRVPIHFIEEITKNIKLDPIEEKICIMVYQITQERKNQNLSQEELAKMAGLTKNTISRIETFTTIPSLSALLKIIESLKLNITISK